MFSICLCLCASAASASNSSCRVSHSASFSSFIANSSSESVPVPACSVSTIAVLSSVGVSPLLFKISSADCISSLSAFSFSSSLLNLVSSAPPAVFSACSVLLMLSTIGSRSVKRSAFVPSFKDAKKKDAAFAALTNQPDNFTRPLVAKFVAASPARFKAASISSSF